VNLFIDMFIVFFVSFARRQEAGSGFRLPVVIKIHLLLVSIPLRKVALPMVMVV
jgi:hypothetical protein